jgi:hypothetical protein
MRLHNDPKENNMHFLLGLHCDTLCLCDNDIVYDNKRQETEKLRLILQQKLLFRKAQEQEHEPRDGEQQWRARIRLAQIGPTQTRAFDFQLRTH